MCIVLCQNFLINKSKQKICKSPNNQMVFQISRFHPLSLALEIDSEMGQGQGQGEGQGRAGLGRGDQRTERGNKNRMSQFLGGGIFPKVVF